MQCIQRADCGCFFSGTRPDLSGRADIENKIKKKNAQGIWLRTDVQTRDNQSTKQQC